LAGSEENGRGHLVVTAPTGGSAGVLPALVYGLGEGGRKLPNEKIRQGMLAAAAIGYLHSAEGGAARAVFTVGFCFGSSNSWRQSASQPDVAGVIGFYGRPERVRDLIPQMRAPLLLLVAGADFTPLAEFQRFDAELTDAGVPHRMAMSRSKPRAMPPCGGAP